MANRTNEYNKLTGNYNSKCEELNVSKKMLHQKQNEFENLIQIKNENFKTIESLTKEIKLKNDDINKLQKVINVKNKIVYECNIIINKNNE